MKKVGLTGNIGSGKTTISHVFKSLGVPVFHSDEQAKIIMMSEPLRSQLIDCFGKKVFKDDVLNRYFLSQIVFNDPEKLAVLNSMVHPQVNTHFQHWCQSQNSTYIIKEAAILFESGSNRTLDAVICVTCPKDIRIQRILERDEHLTIANIEQRISQQWEEHKLVKLSDFVLDNSGQELTVPQVLNIHKQLK